TAMANPISVVMKVWLAFSQMPDQYSIRASTAWLGAGRIKKGVLKRRHTTSQSTKRAKVVSHRVASNSAFLQFMTRASRGRYAHAGHEHNRRRWVCISFPIREVAANRFGNGKSPDRGAMK